MAGWNPKIVMARGGQSKNSQQKKNSGIRRGILALLIIVLVVISFPSLLTLEIKAEESQRPKDPFPISVDPKNETITENAYVDALFTSQHPSLSAAVIEAKNNLGLLASAITSLPGYGVIGEADTRFVTIYPGYRREQVASIFGKVLGWNKDQQKQFLKITESTDPTLSEGEFAPDTYVVTTGAGASSVQKLLDERFNANVLSRYGTSTEAILPIENALTIASLIERETSDPEEMRLISGIIWNRLFTNMNLQIDATLQYAKGSVQGNTKGLWWPQLVSNDKYIKSNYNTYVHAGLPPTPIANPSVIAVIAALNPKKTDCIFYFHDKNSNFHCSHTYEEHVTMLKEYYGRGK
jgi:UPF0755 protein